MHLSPSPNLDLDAGNNTVILLGWNFSGALSGPLHGDTDGQGNPVTFNGVTLEDTTYAITGALVSPQTTMAGLDQGRVTIVGGRVFVNMMDLNYTPSTRVVLELQTVPRVVGDQMNADYRYPDSGSVYRGPHSFVVGSSVEVPNLSSNPTINLDVGNETVTLSGWNFSGNFSGPLHGDTDGQGNPVTFNGLTLQDTAHPITAVRVNSQTSLAGLGASRVTLSSGRVYVNMMDLAYTPSSRVVLDIFTGHVGEFEYTDNGSGVTITLYTGPGGEVVVPATLNGKSVTAIGTQAFAFPGAAITGVSLPGSLLSIGDYAFQFCGFTQVQIPDGVTTIGYQAFYSCANLTNVTLASNVTSVANSAFVFCGSLASAYFQGNAPASFGAGVFDGAAPTFTVYFPAAATGYSTPVWSGYPALPFGTDTGSSTDAPLPLWANLTVACFLCLIGGSAAGKIAPQRS